MVARCSFIYKQRSNPLKNQSGRCWKNVWMISEKTGKEVGIKTEKYATVRRGMLGLVATAVGTSIDAAAVGVSLAFIGANIWIIAAAIGFTTFVATTLGMLIGKVVGVRLGKIAEGLGGVALIVIGLSILLEHLGVIG